MPVCCARRARQGYPEAAISTSVAVPPPPVAFSPDAHPSADAVSGFRAFGLSGFRAWLSGFLAFGLSEGEKEDISKWVKEEKADLTKVLRKMKCKPNTHREKLVTLFYKLCAGEQELKPEPVHLEQLFVKGQGATLPLRWYPGKPSENFDPAKKYYTLLIDGERGVGKTTLLDAFVNFLTGMGYGDTWRYKLANENHMMDKVGAKSQTTEITYYYITDARPNIPESKRIHIKIIDTPGLGDTGGMEEDERILKKFKELFETELEEVDYMLAVTRASEARWTHRAKYIYDQIQQLFGVDALGRFILMCTFDTGGECLAASTMLPQMQCFRQDQYFTFNNQGIYTPKENANPMTKELWDMSMHSVEVFINWIRDQNLPPMSLSQARAVIETRDYLRASVNTAQTLISDGIQTLDSLHGVLKDIKENEDKINKNGSYTYQEKVKRMKWVVLPNQKPYQYCTTCRQLCCQICVWPAGYSESQCTYFNGGKTCPKCPNKCPKSAHQRWADMKEQVEYEETVTRVDEFKKGELANGEKGRTFAETLLNKKQEKMEAVAKKLLKDMQEVKDNLKKLNEIALKPKVFNDEDYFNQLIKAEAERKGEGHQKRIQAMEAMRDRAKLMNQLEKTSNLEDLFPEYKKAIKDALQTAKTESASVKDSVCKCM